MTIEEYRDRLFKAMKRFDREEAEDAARYYAELLEDAEDPEAQMEKLGSPEELAKKIGVENGWINAEEKKGVSGGRIAAVIVSFPLWLTAFIVLAVLIFTLWTVYVSLPLAAAAALVSGFSTLGIYVPYGLILLAGALGIGGLSVLLFRPAILGTRGLAAATVALAKLLFAPNSEPMEHKPMKPLFMPAVFTGAVMLGVGVIMSGAVFGLMKPSAKAYSEKYAGKLGLQNREYVLSSDLNEITTEFNIGDLDVKPSEDGQLRLEGRNFETDGLTVDEATGKIVYKAKRTENHFGIDLWSLTSTELDNFTLYLPEKEYNSLYFEDSFGDIRISGISSKSITADLKSGDIKINGAGADTLTVTDNFGDVKLSDLKSNALSVNARSGDIRLAGITADSIDLRDSFGDIELSDVTAETLIVNSSSGDLDCSRLDISGAMNYQLNFGDAEISGTVGRLEAVMKSGDMELSGTVTGTGDSRIESSFGDVELRLSGADYQILADSDNGDIDLNGRSIADLTPGSGPIIRIHTSSGDIDAKW